jgi:hypothetical protein
LVEDSVAIVCGAAYQKYAIFSPNFFPHPIKSNLAKAVTPLTFIRVMPGLNFDMNTDYS